MKRMVFTIIGLAVVAGGAMWVSGTLLKPKAEEAQADKNVLSGAYAARLEMCTLLEDSELPEGIKAPGIGSDIRYVQLVVLFPEVNTIKGKGGEYVLDFVNGKRTDIMKPVSAGVDVESEGVFLSLTFETDGNFEHARLRHGKAVVIKRVELE